MIQKGKTYSLANVILNAKITLFLVLIVIGFGLTGCKTERIGEFVRHYNYKRYHESLDNVTPADMYYGRYHQIMDQRAMIKQQTLQQRRCENLKQCA